jgi:2-polyprenyl-3-methyl-5-hydroxy-6-metoxy-1,4-benzoquinol methylase
MKKHYTSSFGVEWSNYPDVQLDSQKKYDWNISTSRLELVLGFPLEFLLNKKVIEIGCGPGRFSEILKKYCKELTIVDSSDAIEHNLAIHNKNVFSYKIDFTNETFVEQNKNKFDVVFCRGVIQHTEDSSKAILSLFKFAKISPKGLVIFDVYPRKKSNFNYFFTDFKYFWRRVLPKVIAVEKFVKILNNNLDVLNKAHSICQKLRNNFLIKFLLRFFPFINVLIMPDFLRDHPGISDKKYQSRLIASLLVDGIYSYYDNPMSMKEVNHILANIGQNYYSVDSNRCIVRCKRNESFIACNFDESKNGIRLIKSNNENF